MTDPGGMPPRDPLRPDDPYVPPPATSMPPPDLGAVPPQPVPPPMLPATGTSTMMSRLQRMLKNENGVFAEIGADKSATVQALIIAAAANLLANLFPVRVGTWIGALIGGVIAVAIGAGIFWLLAKAFKGNGDYGSMFRATGYAMAPQALGVIPIIGSIVGFFWTLWLLVKAVKETQHTTNGGAWATVLIPMAVLFLLAFLLFAAFIAALTGIAVSAD